MGKINFIDELEKLKQPVWQKIKTYLPDKNPHKHYDMVREYPLRQGKYFRPGLVLLGTQLLGGNTNKALLTATAMQVSEDWLLIHDDAEDHSQERRHKPTLNAMHGYELAINAGDALHMIMWKILGDAAKKLGVKTGWQVFEKMNEVLLTTTEGQYMELQWIYDKKVFVSEKEYLQMIKRKTACYTIIGPLQLGAMISGASASQIKSIEIWGRPFGYAFQIWDDCMNVSSSAKKQGKEFAGDIMEGKRTLILSHLLKHCAKNERKNVERIYQKTRQQKTQKEKQYILRLMNNYGSIEYVKKIARNYGDQAAKLFDKHTSKLPKSRAKNIIRAGINFVTHREH